MYFYIFNDVITKMIAIYELKMNTRIKTLVSNWKSYWGSNKYLKELLETEPKENFERTILVCCPTKKLLTYYEVKLQMVYQVLEKPDEFFNDNILGKFFTKDFEI